MPQKCGGVSVARSMAPAPRRGTRPRASTNPASVWKRHGGDGAAGCGRAKDRVGRGVSEGIGGAGGADGATGGGGALGGAGGASGGPDDASPSATSGSMSSAITSTRDSSSDRQLASLLWI